MLRLKLIECHLRTRTIGLIFLLLLALAMRSLLLLIRPLRRHIFLVLQFILYKFCLAFWFRLSLEQARFAHACSHLYHKVSCNCVLLIDLDARIHILLQHIFEHFRRCKKHQSFLGVESSRAQLLNWLEILCPNRLQH